MASVICQPSNPSQGQLLQLDEKKEQQGTESIRSQIRQEKLTECRISRKQILVANNQHREIQSVPNWDEKITI